jgi:hypothetical protein
MRPPFSIKVRLDPLKMADRYCWAISEGERTVKHSSHTYGTLIQAEAAANEALSRIEAQRRRGK